MIVKAAPGLKVPMENKPHDYVTDAVAVEVPDTAYYLRRVTDGDLINQPLDVSLEPLVKSKNSRSDNAN